EAFLDVSEQTEDYMGATIMAQMIKARIKEECGERVTCSIGVAPNKLLAKLASEIEKPDGLIVIKPKDIPRLLGLVELRDFCGIGHGIEKRLNMLGIYSVEQLQHFPVSQLVEEFKSYGFWLHSASHGRDQSIVGTDTRKGVKSGPKSIGHSYTFPHDLWDPLEMKRGLLGLAEKVGWRLRRDGFISREVSTYIRYGDFTGVGKIKRFHEATNNGLQLLRIAWSLIEQVRNDTKPIRLLGISAGRLSRGTEQVSLFPQEQKIQTVMSALDQIQTRYGNKAWTRASLLGIEFKERSSGFHFDEWN
ncbi:MAG: DNA polymerase IV, partial [Candidatus Uhrbacteria bacterium]